MGPAQDVSAALELVALRDEKVVKIKHDFCLLLDAVLVEQRGGGLGPVDLQQIVPFLLPTHKGHLAAVLVHLGLELKGEHFPVLLLAGNDLGELLLERVGGKLVRREEVDAVIGGPGGQQVRLAIDVGGREGGQVDFLPNVVEFHGMRII